MLAAGLDFAGRTLAEFSLPDPIEPQAGEVLLQVAEVGVCATDRELARFHFGRPPAGESLLALGHEALARVLSVGPGVEALQPGQHVVPMIREACSRRCRSCSAGRFDLCETGGYLERGIVGKHGYLASHAIDPASSLLVVPTALVDCAVLIEPLSVVEKAMEAAWRNAAFPPRSAVVFGAGPVGLLTVLALLERGVRVVCRSMEPEDHPRARLAQAAGASYESAGSASMRADLVIEASGSPLAAQLAFDALAPLGILVLIGAADFELRFPGLRTVVENQTILGVVNAGRTHFEAALADLARFDRRIVSRMIQRRPFAEWREAVTTQGATTAIKTTLPLH